MDIPTSDANPPTTGLAIQRVPLDALHLDPANARVHDDVNLDAIKASLTRFGQAEPLVVHKSTGRVIGGNGHQGSPWVPRSGAFASGAKWDSGIRPQL